MNCERCRRKVSDYLDSELSREEHREMEEHLAECAECRRVVASWRRTLQAVQDLPRREAPAGLSDAIQARIEGKPEEDEEQPAARPAIIRLMPQLAAAAAVLLVVVGAGLFLWSKAGEPTQPSRTAMQQAPEEETAEPAEAPAAGKGAATTDAQDAYREESFKATPEASPEKDAERKAYDRAAPKTLNTVRREGLQRDRELLFFAGEDARQRAMLDAPPKDVITLHVQDPLLVLNRVVALGRRRGADMALRLPAGPAVTGRVQVLLAVKRADYTPLLEAISSIGPAERKAQEKHRSAEGSEKRHLLRVDIHRRSSESVR